VASTIRDADWAAEPHAKKPQVSATVPDGGEPSGTVMDRSGGSGVRFQEIPDPCRET
jgi:hypothetical protein